ncbi:hypothetical protein AAFC00_003987 [Neodothiora populina]|uniref:Mediator of RNA polymerase II transcription subunit 22 n=2 Tax=Neodothiora populina TaxID=2781224 RepID=A0ABR3PID5_9PEZI
MDSIPRNTPALMARIDQIRNNMLKRFENLIELAAVDKTDRNTTALNQYQMQVETAALIRTSEDILTMTRQMQELWLFGQLKTLEQREDLQERIDSDAEDVAGLLTQLLTAESLMEASEDVKMEVEGA